MFQLLTTNFIYFHNDRSAPNNSIADSGVVDEKLYVHEHQAKLDGLKGNRWLHTNGMISLFFTSKPKTVTNFAKV